MSAGAGNVADDQLETTGTALFRGGMIGRYIVLGLLGKGGMGVVYSAYDPELDRKVALKLLRVAHRKKGEDFDAKRTRLLREAKAIARLSHPSVVVVYDVGTFQDQVFIAMELVDGMTAIRWRDTRKPSWREVLRVFIDAGEGIAAAHAASLVHRDFKPDNVMVTREGKVRVMDFGLARTMERITEETAIPDGPADADGPTLPGMRAAEPRLTNEGNVVGTPAYMPPEQYLGVTDERSDQFSFCVSLYECIYGQHPFEARTSMGLTSNMQQGRVHDAPAHTKVPVWVRRILLKGLRPRPEDRYPSMRELLTALGHDPAVARRRWLVMGAVVAAAGALVLGVEHASDSKRAFCAAGPDKLSAAWELPGRRGDGIGPKHAAVTKAFLATGKPYAQDAIRSLSTALDEYATKWVALYRDACEATHVRGEQSEELLDLRMSCLNDRLSGFRALTDLLTAATGEVVEHAVDAAHALTPLDQCNNVVQLRSLLPSPDPKVRARVEALRRELGQIKAVHDAGRFGNAIERLGPVVGEARSLRYKPLEAEALTRLGAAHVENGENALAESAYEEALLDAIAAHHDDLLGEIAGSLVWAVGHQDRFVEAGRWMRFAQAAIERTSGFNSLSYAWLLNNMGAILYIQDKLPESVEYSEQAFKLKEAILGLNDPDLANTLGNLALSLGALGRTEEALRANEQATLMLRSSLGAAHPRVANELSNRGEILVEAKRWEAAVSAYSEAERIWGHDPGSGAAEIAYALTGHGRALLGLDHPAAAIPLLESALRIREGKDLEGNRLGETEFALGRALWQAHRDPSRAQALAEAALTHFRQANAPSAVTQVTTWLAEHRASRSIAVITR